MRTEELVNEWQHAKAYFLVKHGERLELASDFAAYCAQKWLEGQRLSSNLHQLSIEYLRTVLPLRGRKMDLMSNRGRVKEKRLLKLAADTDSTFFKFDANDAIARAQLAPNAQAVLRLRVFYGFSLMEIGKLFGVSESRVNRILKAAESNLKKAHASP